MKYRAEIDGLRALSVVPVILFHAGFELFSGGFVGVDVFFVISGYLITTILYEQRLSENFSIVEFYDRRIRRILPPLIITGLITVAIAISFTPSDIKNVGQSLVATYTFLSNYFFYLETDYFNPFNTASPLLHTWSLAVEEQYYLFAPFLIYAIAKLRLFKYFIVTGFLLASFYAAVTLTNTNPNLSFYSIHTRAWELLLGTLIAFLCKDYSQLKPNKYLSELLSALSLLLLALSFTTIDENFSHPSYVTALPVLSTAILIYFAPTAPRVKALLSFNLLVRIGLISYALYLFHNPIFSAITYHFEEQALLLKVLSLPLIVLLSVLSFKYVETPSRSALSSKRKGLYAITAISMTLLLSFGYMAHKQNGFLSFFKSKFDGDANLIVNVEMEQELIQKAREQFYPSDIDFDCIDENCQRILLVGDSFSEDAYLSLQSLANTKYSIRRIHFDDECMGEYIPSMNVQLCRNNKVDMNLINDADIVIITAKWQENTYRDGFVLAETIQNNSDASVFLVGSVMFEDLSSFAFRLSGMTDDMNRISEMAYIHQRFDRLRISDKLKKLVEGNSSMHWIEKSDFFCNSLLQSCSLYDEDFNPLIWDNAHLTTRTYVPYGSFLIDSVENSLVFDE